MRNAKVSQEAQRIRSLIQRTQKACAEDIELSSHWAKYLCVLSSGFLENSIAEIYGDFSDKSAHEPVARYTRARLSTINNPKAETFAKTAGAFKADWEVDLRTFMEDEGRKDAVDSIMRLRHLIAHGREKDAGVTVARISDYLERSIQILEYIETQCEK